jgi:hypothetical protein
MTSERRKFRPYELPVALGHFLDESRLLVGNDEGIYVEPFGRRVVSDTELRAGAFSLALAPNTEAYAELLDQAVAVASEEFGAETVGLVVVVSSSYLKLAEVVLRRPLVDVARVMPLTNGVPARPFGAVFHGCDVEAALVLLDDLDEGPLKPSRKGTWFSRARFELRTGLDGSGFNVLPLTDEIRAELHLHRKTLRYVDLGVSPIELSASSAVNLYVDSDLLARLNREMSKSWAVAFSDQLAVDVLSAIALRAVADPSIHDKEWSEVEESLLGALITMVDGNTGGDEAETTRRRQDLLEELRTRPTRFLALVEGAVEMRDNTRRLVGG